MNKKIRLGMIGGGPNAFIGAVHRIASRIDNEYEIVCGAFSSSLEKSLQTGNELGISESRIYPSFQDLITKEKALPEQERVQVISIVTPNHLHFEPAKMAMEQGFHVILDKPMTLTLAEAKELKQAQEKTGKKLLLTHTYTGYPMVKEAKQVVASGKLGKIRKIYVEYPQGWLSNALEDQQAVWRTDPSKSGIAGAMGDIGTHAFNLAEYISGLAVTKLCADINIVVPNRRLDDDGAVLLKFGNEVSGVLMATQIAAGEENKVKIRVYGEKGGLEWHQEDANSLVLKWLDAPAQTYRTGTPYLSSFATHNTRTPSGHPEGYLEAFANLYRNFALCVKAELEGKAPEKEAMDYPGIEEGIRGMAFIETVIESGKSDQKWIDFKV
jgi:predicted dehydrogenase